MVTLNETIIIAYPELDKSDLLANGTIILKDDLDGLGAYIKKWDYDKPIPEGLKLGK